MRRTGAVAVAALPLVAAGPAPAGEPGFVRSLIEMRHEQVVMQEWDLSCGAAAITTVLNHQFGEELTEYEVATTLMQRAEYIRNPALVNLRQGFSLLDLKRLVDARGYEGVGFGRMDLETLLERAPAIVPIDTEGYNHFVVVRGAAGDRVLMADPAWGNRTMTRDAFERAWIDYGELGHVAFVVTRDGEIAPPGALAPDPGHFVTFN
jgi:hypothetical protein